MAKTVVGMFDNYRQAQDAVQDLIDNGVSAGDISLVANDARGQFKNYRAGNASPTGDFDTPDNTGGTQGAEGATAGAVGGGVLGGAIGLLAGLGALAIPGIGPVLAAGPLVAALGSAGAGAVAGAGIGAAGGGLIGGLVGLGIPDEDANMYAEGVRRGGTLVTVRTDDAMADRAADILEHHGAVDLDKRGAEWRQGGWSRFDTNAKPYTTQEIDTARTSAATTSTTSRNLDQGEAVLPVVEEELQVGKRQVQRGGARIHTKIEEKPVEEQVNLREERVRVERRPVDRPVDAASGDLFKEQSYEVTETAEEPVVQKRARVVEEVVLNKDVQERTETVRDTVRRQDVHVHEQGDQGAEQAVGASAYDTFDSDFRNDFTTKYGDRGYTYDQYQPVYRYGYTLATDPRYRDRDWADIETDARTRWEERNPGTWENFKDSVRYAWDRARGAR
jgi:uncharacterized protein (TIGR02271 family)